MRCEFSTRCSISASSRSARRLFGVAALTALPALAVAQPLTHAPRVASYTLRAKLDSVDHRVEGHGTISFFNYTQSALHELYVHLYMNAFKNDESLFLRSPFGAGRSGQHGSKWGYIDVKRLYAREAQSDLWPNHAPKTPDDPDDETDIR